MSLTRHSSIVVLGAGISGLVFASTLKKLGFGNVRVFEKQERVGGKSCTRSFDGRAHDLGATMGVPIDYDFVNAQASRTAIRSIPFPKETHYDLITGRPRSLNRRRELPKVLYQAGKYFLLHSMVWKGVDGSGLEHASTELHRPWSEVARRRRCQDVSERFLTYRTGYGYGFDDEVPAAMYANLIRTTTLRGLVSAKNFMWEGGTQPIWEGVARDLDVTTGVDVQRIRRTSRGVDLSVVHQGEARVEHCDYVVIAFDAKAALSVLDATTEERRAFGAIRSYPYATFAARVRGLAPGRASVGYIAENMTRGRMGRPMAWVKRYADDDVFVFHLFAPPELSDSEVDANIAADMRALGGEVVSTCERRRWDFFPHYAPSDFGFVREVAERQGANRTVVLGEAFSFATMARVAEHAERVATRFARGELASEAA